MTRYLISYDIRQGNEYDPILDVLTELGAVKILRSQWAVRSKLSVVELRDRVAVALSPGDRLLVSRLDDETFEGWCLSTDLDAI